MARTTSTGRGRRNRYTDEQRAERDRQDRELLDRAARTLAGDAQVIGDFVRQAVGGMSPRILGYSLRNQMLLMEQAADRGVRLADVDTFTGWQRRGRCVRRGEHGLRIIRPVGTIDDDAHGNDDPEPADHPDTEEERAERVRFRMMVVFDVSQTDEVDDPQARDCPACDAGAGEPCTLGCTCPGCTGDLTADNPEGTPGELLWNNLYEQITRAEYRFDWPAADITGRVRVDHDARAVRVALHATADDPDALADLATAVAQILTRADADRAARRTARAPLPSTQPAC